MKIVKAEAFLCDVAVEAVRTDAIQSFAKQETIFLDIEMEDGLVGTGYSYTMDSAKGDLAPRTYHNYRLQIRKHISPTIGSLKLSKLTAAHVQSLYAAKLG